MIFTSSPPGQCQRYGDNARGDVALQQRRDRPVHDQLGHGRTLLCPLHVNHRVVLRPGLPPGGHFEVDQIFYKIITKRLRGWWIGKPISQMIFFSKKLYY